MAQLGKSSHLVACSAMIAPARRLVFYRFRTWIDQIVRIAVHTFVVDESKVPLNPEKVEGYWYCAGGFCDIDESGVSQHIGSCDIEFAECLVAPNIKDDDPERPEKVIAGEYGIHYVCHNITNRVLYATDDRDTLIDIDIPVTGYEVVVKSALGIYGQNKVEWSRRRQGCIDGCYQSDPPPSLALAPERTRDEEMHRIHLRAANGDIAKAQRLTVALKDIDNAYLLETDSLVKDFDRQVIDREVFHTSMVATTRRMFDRTIREVGLENTKKIYPHCELETTEPTSGSSDEGGQSQLNSANVAVASNSSGMGAAVAEMTTVGAAE